MWTSYRIETRSKNENSWPSKSPATFESFADWNEEKSKYIFSKPKYNAYLEKCYIESAIERSKDIL